MAATHEGKSFGLEWKVHQQHGLTTLALKGELDLASVDIVDELAQGLIAAEPVLVFDLEQLAFMDSTGLRLLGRIHRKAESEGHRVLLARVSPAVRRVLHVAGLVDYFEYVEGAPPEEKLCSACDGWVQQDATTCTHCGAAL